MRGMWNIHVDVPDLVVGLVDHQNFLGRLDEVNRLEAAGKGQELRNAGRRAVCPRRRSEPFSEQLLVGFLQAVDDPGFQIRVAQIGQAHRRFHDIAPVVGVTRHHRMRLVVGYGSKTGCGRKKVRIAADPGKVDRGEVRNRGLSNLAGSETLRCRGAGANETSEKTDRRHVRYVFLLSTRSSLPRRQHVYRKEARTRNGGTRDARPTARAEKAACRWKSHADGCRRSAIPIDPFNLSTLLTGLISVKQPSAKRDNLSIQTVSTLIDFC